MSEFKIPEQWRQTSATVVVNLLSVHIGVFLSWTMTGHPTEWSGANIRNFSWNWTERGIEVVETTSFPMTLLRRLPFILILILLPFTIFICERFGRKIALAISTVPFVITTLTIIAAKGPTVVPIAFGAGACAMQLYLVPIYVSEISGNSKRGAHGVIRALPIGIGLYLGYFKAEVWLKPLHAVFSLLLPMVFLMGLKVLPESPVWLVKKKRISEAERALTWLRIDYEQLDQPESVKLNEHPESMKLNEESENIQEPDVQQIVKSAEMCKGFLVTIVLVVGQGIVQINSFDTYIFIIQGMNHWIPNRDVVHLIIIMIHAVVCLITSLLIDRVGRRPLLITSCIVMAVTYCVGYACFAILQKDLSTISTQTRIIIGALATIHYIFYIFGLGSVSTVTAVEILPNNVPYAISMIGFWIVPWMVSEIRYTIAWFLTYIQLWSAYAVFCVLLVAFVAILVPETKGKSIYPINRESLSISNI